MKPKKVTRRISLRKDDVFTYKGTRYVYVCSTRCNVGAPAYLVYAERTGVKRLWNVEHMKACLEAGTIAKAS